MTMIIAFALQNHQYHTVVPLVENYGALAKGHAFHDHLFHLILTHPTKKIGEEELLILA